MAERVIDAVLFSSLLVAAAAACLSAAVGVRLAGEVPLAVPALAFCGTLVVYGVDRLRDVERDRESAPLRARFVARHRGALVGLAGAALLASLFLVAGLAASLAAGMAPVVGVVLVPAVALGLVHRRIKGVAGVKPLYISAAWLLVTVALPALATGASPGAARGAAREAGWAAAVVGLALFANAVAANVRDNEAGAARYGRGTALRVARVCAVLGVAVGLAAPPALRPLLAVPAATGLALVPFQDGERYGLGVVDGALLVGAVIALVG